MRLCINTIYKILKILNESSINRKNINLFKHTEKFAESFIANFQNLHYKKNLSSNAEKGMKHALSKQKENAIETFIKYNF